MCIRDRSNKCPFIHEITKSGNPSKIIGITETWANQNFDGEYTAHFKGFNIAKSDRDISQDNPNEEHLKKQGGVMLITSSDLPINTIKTFSNGNCELLITELPTINTAILVLYSPSGKNFTLAKFNAALSQIHCYLETEFNKTKDQQLIIMGDFNFRPEVVEWVQSDHGLIADYKEGLTEEKRAFNMLTS